LGGDIIVVVECLKSWGKAGIVEVEKIQELEEMLHALGQ
jgi:hypothetical protein